MIPLLATICLLAPTQGPIHAEVHRSGSSDTLFSVNGIDGTGAATLEHLKVLEKEGVTSIGDPKVGGHGTWARLSIPVGTTPWKSVQVAFTYSVEGPFASFGDVQLTVEKDAVWILKDNVKSKVSSISAVDLIDVQIQNHAGSISVFVNGMEGGKSVSMKGPAYPLEIGVDPFKGNLIGVTAYSRELSADEIQAIDKAVKDKTKALFADTAKITIEGEMTAFTPVPELERIRPYRSALLAEEYKVTRVVTGRMSSVKPGMKIRIFRYGIKAGEKTAVKDAKVGSHATMLIQPFDSDPKFGREFSVNDLDPDITIPQFVDVTPEN